jgi:hypothetical protein
MQFKVVSYFTRETIYETIMFNYLLPSLNTFTVPNSIYSIDDTKQWKTNAAYQPAIILKAMIQWPNEAIVWMDCDNIVRCFPRLFNEIPARCDIGIYYLQFEDHWGGTPPGVDVPRPQLNTGVIWFNNTPKMRQFVEEWLNRCQLDKKLDHREHLELLIDDYLMGDFSFFMIPRGYAYIAEREDGEPPAVGMSDPCVMQFMASVLGKKNLYKLPDNLKGQI